MGIKTEFNWKTKVSSCIDDIYLRITNVYNTLSGTTNEIYTRLQQTINEVNTIVATLHTIKPGYMLPYAGSDIPEGYLLCNGAVVSRTTYKDLFNRIGTTYGAGDGSTTFNLPNLVNRYIMGSDGTNLSKYIKAQLPNINGSYEMVQTWHMNYAGAFSATKGSCYNHAADVYQNDRYISFNANSSNSIYTNNGSVRPLSFALNFIIKF